MNTHPRLCRPSGLWAGLGFLVLSALLAGTWLTGDLPAQNAGRGQPAAGQRATGKQGAVRPQREEEEEEAPPVKNKSIRVEDEQTRRKVGPARTAVPPAPDLQRAARETSHPVLRQLFSNLAVPHDQVTFKAHPHIKQEQEARVEQVEPIPQYVGDNPDSIRGMLTLRPLDNEWKPLKPYQATAGSIQSIKPYEQIAQDAVREFLDLHLENVFTGDVKYLSRYDQYAAAELVLAAVLRFDESAQVQGRREGEAWDPIVNGLRKQLLDVQVTQLNLLAEARDWDRAFALARRLTETYTDPNDVARVAKPLTEVLQAALKDPTSSPDKLREVRRRLLQLEEQFPNSDAVRPLADSLRDQAQALFNQAKVLAKSKDPKQMNQAMELLKQAEDTWPHLPGLHTYVLELDQKHPVLRVGVRELPRYLSPARASTDTELRCVELLFESLVEPSVDGAGVFRYRPGLAEGRPQGVPLGRRFQLPRNAAWSNGRPLNAGDIRHTLGLLKEGKGTGRSAAWGELLEAVRVGGDPFRVDVTLRQGYLDPLSPMAFKVLPSQTHPDPDSEEFAQKPVGSGPFRYDGVRSEQQGLEYASFLANPGYSSRTGKLGLPRIQEVRLFAYKDPVKDFDNLHLHLALGLSAPEAAALAKQGVTVPLPESGKTSNRRVYFLAVNQHRPDLAIAELRRALTHAINRERLLDDHFRTGLGRQVHRAINSPWPAGSWPCDPTLHSRADKDSLDLYDADLAKTLIKEASSRGYRGDRLTLKYPDGDPVVEQAMTNLRDQVKTATGVELALEKRDPRLLRQDVEVTGEYQLAYYHYDFPDETLWLWPLLGTSGSGGDNYLGYHGQEVQNLLDEAKGHRNFPEVQKLLRTVHGLLVSKEMPVVPLWQLAPLNGIGGGLKAGPFDPLLVFTDMEEWRLEALR